MPFIKVFARQIYFFVFILFSFCQFVNGQTKPPVPLTEAQIDSLIEINEEAKAISILRKQIKQATADKDWRVLAKYRITLAYVLSFSDQIQESLKQSEIAIKLIETHLSPSDSLLQKALIRRGELMLETGQADSAIAIYKRSFPLSVSLEKWENAAFAKIGTAVANLHLGQFEKVEQPLLKAREIHEAYLKDNNDIADIIHGLSGVYYDIMGNFDGALENTLTAISFLLSKTTTGKQDSLRLSTYYNNIGAHYYSKGDYEQATNYYQNAILLKEATLSRTDNIASSYNNLALVYIAKGDLELSLDALNKSQQLSSAPSKENAANLTILFCSIARYHILNKNFDQAKIYAEKAIKLKSLAPDLAYLSLRRMGEVYLALDAPQIALGYLDQAKKALLTSEEKTPLTEAVLSRVTADAFLQLGEPAAALEEAQNGLQHLYPSSIGANLIDNPNKGEKNARFEGIRILRQKAIALAKLAPQQLDAESYLEYSIATFELLFHWADSTRQEYLSAVSKQLLTQETHQSYDQAIEVALNLYELTKRESYLNKAFKFAERNKAIVMQERFQDNRAKLFAQIPDSLLQLEISIKKDLAFYNKKIQEANYSDKPDQIKLSFWSQKVLELNNELQQLIHFFENEYRAYYQLKYINQSISKKEVQALLPNDKSLLAEFFVGEQYIYLFTLGRNASSYRKIPKPDHFTDEILAFRQSLSAPPNGSARDHYNEYTKLAHQWYALLLESSLADFPNCNQLIIVPDQMLSYLPFDCLLSSPNTSAGINYADLPYLFNDYIITYTYSASLLQKLLLSVENNRTDKKLIAFAPDFSSNPQTSASYISGNKKELEAIQKLFPKEHFYIGEQALKHTFLDESPKYDIIHLATHGLADENAPLFSKLLFHDTEISTEDSPLYTYELYNLILSARLVVLSACETGHGKFSYGEGVLSLASGFMHTGCQNITQSLWAAQDQSTALLMEFYYQFLSDGASVSEALQLAKKEYLKSPLAQKHPFYWSGFINVGIGHSIIFDAGFPLSGKTYLLLLALVGIIIMVSFFIKKKRM